MFPKENLVIPTFFLINISNILYAKKLKRLLPPPPPTGQLSNPYILTKMVKCSLREEK